jgi:hypothetical protein
VTAVASSGPAFFTRTVNVSVSPVLGVERSTSSVSSRSALATGDRGGRGVVRGHRVALDERDQAGVGDERLTRGARIDDGGERQQRARTGRESADRPAAGRGHERALRRGVLRIKRPGRQVFAHLDAGRGVGTVIGDRDGVVERVAEVRCRGADGVPSSMSARPDAPPGCGRCRPSRGRSQADGSNGYEPSSAARFVIVVPDVPAPTIVTSSSVASEPAARLPSVQSPVDGA